MAQPDIQGRARAKLLLKTNLLVLSAALMYGCSGTSAADSLGGLRPSGDPAEVCIPAQPGTDLTFGMEILANDSTTDITLLSAKLIDPKGLSEGGAWTTPIVDQTLIGFIPDKPENVVRGGQLQELRKSQLRVGSVVNLVVGIQWNGQNTWGSAGGLEVRYSSSDGTDFVWKSTTSIFVGETCVGRQESS